VGLPTLALGSLIALFSIIIGGVFGMKYLEEGSITRVTQDIIKRGEQLLKVTYFLFYFPPLE